MGFEILIYASTVALVVIFYAIPLSLMTMSVIPKQAGAILVLALTVVFTIMVMSLERRNPGIILALVFAYSATLYSLLGNWMFGGGENSQA
jgi:prepilin signal peptidase PulO-like enzyme (type II secretory pathway)